MTTRVYLTHVRYLGGSVSPSLPELRVTEFLRFCLLKIPLGAYSILAFFRGRLLQRETGKVKREELLDSPS